MYNFRVAEDDDIDSVMEMGQKFYDTMDIAKMIPFEEDSCSAMVFNMLDNGFIVLAEKEGQLVGMAGFLISDYPFNREYQVCNEVMFWVEPEYRGTTVAARLLKEAEEVAKFEGVNVIAMAALNTSPEMIDKFYNKLGYVQSERTFMKGV